MPDLVTLLLQLVAIVVVTRLAGRVIAWVGQPRVVGEMAAGILLGPSLLGWAAPTLFRGLFPAESLPYLSLLSQLGLLLFMFLVGLEFDTSAIRDLGRVAVATSAASIVAPFLLGAAAASYLYPHLADPHVPEAAFVLFLGAAMSVTAFPVLARILAELGLTRSELGRLAIACASIDDVCAWFILAYVVAYVAPLSGTTPNQASVGALFAQVTAFALLMLFAVRPLLKRLKPLVPQEGRVTESNMGVALLLMLLSAAATEWIGIHFLFGAFLLGAILPKDAAFVHGVSDKLESVVKVLLLPIYFVYTGLHTSIGALRGDAWMYCGLIAVVAVAGKLGGAYSAAAACGLPWRNAAALGALLNTRGLMQLIILNVGRELGVIDQTVFSMMVIVALASTALTAPLVKTLHPAPQVGFRKS